MIWNKIWHQGGVNLLSQTQFKDSYTFPKLFNSNVHTMSYVYQSFHSESIWYESCFSNMSKLVQIQYGMNLYDSQTCH